MKRREFLVNAGLAAAITPHLARSAVPCPPPSVSVSGGSTSTTACGPSKAPAWFTAMADKTWAAIAGGANFGAAYQNGSTISNVSPTTWTGNEGPSAVLNDWTGGCASQSLKEVYLPCQGGHDGFYNSTIYALNVQAAVPSWQLIWQVDPTIVSSDLLGDNPTSYQYSDGSPRTTHGYYGSQFCDKNNRIWITFLDAGPTGSWGTNVYSIDRTNIAAGWMYHGRQYTAAPNGVLYMQACAGSYDPVAHKIWTMADQAISPAPGVYAIDCAAAVAAGTQSTTTGPQVPGITTYNTVLASPSWAGWSSVLNDRGTPFFVCGSANGGRNEALIMDIANNPGVIVEKSTVGTGRWQQGDGGVYHAASKAFLVFQPSGGGVSGTSPTIYKMAISAGNPLNATFTWSTVTNDPSNTVTPATDQGNQFNGIYSKLQLIEDMGNGQGALVLMSGYRGPAYVYKLPLAGV